MSSYKLLVVDDDSAARRMIREYLVKKGYLVQEAGTGVECIRCCQSDSPQAILMECSLPDIQGLHLLRRLREINFSVPVMMMTSHATVELAVRAVKDGAEQLIAKPADISSQDAFLEDLHSFVRSKRSEYMDGINVSVDKNPFLGTSDGIKRLEEAARRIVGTDCPILINGETGTGKGVLALWLHKNGKRSGKPFVDLNCAGLNRDLLESDLFGHEKGSFTGAVTGKPGIMEVANRGTMFLDEIGDMDLAIQPKLLKALDEKKVRRVGGVIDHSVDVNLIAATHCELSSLVSQGKFRPDLFFRINTIPLNIPSLRDRAEDIPLLAYWFLRNFERRTGADELRFSTDAMGALREYHWPGNIRELRSIIEHAALICNDGEIKVSELRFQPTTPIAPADFPPPNGNYLTMDELQRQYIAYALKRENGEIDKVAVKLGISRSSLYAKIKQYGLR